MNNWYVVRNQYGRHGVCTEGLVHEYDEVDGPMNLYRALKLADAFDAFDRIPVIPVERRAAEPD